MKRTIKIIIQLVIIALIGFTAQYVIRHVIYPTWTKDSGGSLGIEKFDDFYALKDDTIDILFIGSSHSNLTFVPMIINEKTKTDSFLLGAHGLPVIAMPYFLEEALKTQKPKIVVVELYSVNSLLNRSTKAKRQYEDFHKSTDGLRLSMNKLKMIWDNVPKEKRLEHVFPIIAHHASWYSDKFVKRVEAFLNPDFDPNPFFGYESVSFLTNTLEGNPIYDTSTIEISDDMIISDSVFEYFDMIVELCKQNDIQLVFAVSPMTNTETSDVTNYANDVYSLLNALSEYMDKNDIGIVNMYEHLDEMGVEKMDMLDDGHFNISGAQKASNFFADYLNENYSEVLKNCQWDYEALSEEKMEAFNEDLDWFNAQKPSLILEHQLEVNTISGNLDTYFDLINHSNLPTLYVVNKVDIDQINDPVKQKLLAMGWDKRLLDGKSTFAVVVNDSKMETFINEDIKNANITASDMGIHFITEIIPGDTVSVHHVHVDDTYFTVDTNEILVIAYNPITKRPASRTVTNLDQANNPVYSIGDKQKAFMTSKNMDEINLEQAVKVVPSSDETYNVRVTPESFDAELAVIEVTAKCRYETIMTVSAGGIDTNVQLITGDNKVYAAVDLSRSSDFEINFDTIDNVTLQAIRIAGIK